MDALHPKREPPQQEQKSPALADEQKQSTPGAEGRQATSSPDEKRHAHQKVKLRDVNSSLTCHLCKGYLIDATTISECLHSFCRSCIIKFLEENSFCPVCEVIINKAKPNLKLDKTLQDIVYKLVPGLFLSEMMRRRNFYADKPAEAGRVSPEQRGEDTERTIFNPQDRISLSLEYIGDAATTGLILKDLKQKQEAEDVQAESLLKRYLQCPAMCRIDVIKKFIRNKYNVNTDLFQIDILYKRVPLPLPDHYTLVDVAYIYTWKRNAPMRFYFRITDKGCDDLPDLTKVFTASEDSPFPPRPLALSTPDRNKGTAAAAGLKDKHRKTPKKAVKKLPPVVKSTKKKDEETICDKNEEETKEVDKGTDKVYTNITLNRANNVEIVTKIQKLSDKEGQKIEVNVIDQKTEVEEVKDAPKEEPSTSEDHAETKSETKQDSSTPEVTSTTSDLPPEDEELEKTKFEFLKSIELTAKKVVDNIARLVHQQQQTQKQTPSSSQPTLDVAKPKKPAPTAVKRKPSSPLKNEPKKPKVEPKRTTKIILQQKPGYPPLNLSKPAIPEDLIKQNRNELRSLFQTCRLNIPSSLSITLKENGETSRQPVQMPPVQNFIEILKIDEKAGTQTVTLKRDEAKNPEAQSQFPNTLLGAVMRQMEQARKKGEGASEKQQSFQKIFEESIKKVEATEASLGKKKILDIAQQLYKRTKVDGEAKKTVVASQKIAIPRLNNQRVVKPPKRSVKYETHQTLTNLHSSSLGLNYTVSVGKAQKPFRTDGHFRGPASVPPPQPSPVTAKTEAKIDVPSPQTSKGLISPSPSPKIEQGCVPPPQSSPRSFAQPKPGSENPTPKPGSGNPSPSPKTEQGCLPPPIGSPMSFSQSSSSKSKSPKPGSGNLSPKPSSGNPSPKPGFGNPSPIPKFEQGCLPPALGSPRSFSQSSPRIKSPKPGSGNPSPKPRSNEVSPKPKSSNDAPKPVASSSSEFNAQNLAQLSASMNFDAQAYLSSMSSKQVTALHQAMLMKQLELHNRQSWFNINQAPLLQYEKYLQNLNASKKLMGNLKDN